MSPRRTATSNTSSQEVECVPLPLKPERLSQLGIADGRLWLPVPGIVHVVLLLISVSDMQLNLVPRFIVERILLLPVYSCVAATVDCMSQQGALCRQYTNVWHVGQR